ncbi:hypothetical protein LTR56_026434 [Elasticomyces elasticus]|nr:hypothetical protein LTR56_026434 [Elasticomyces elasticus]KAK3616448.1 hypothetical protein LTR22_027067 [Elasticomyces elasticus]KAK4901072.1 hypothetical protein LTR49_027323 [Elasticomyces elasticus]KAK5736499.1 hypothetical protein LTS12_026155 [Elasticomyces elasticus]
MGPGVTVETPKVPQQMNNAQYIAYLRLLPIIHNIEFCKLATRIQDSLAARTLDKFEDLFAFDAEMVRWHDELPPILKEPSSSGLLSAFDRPITQRTPSSANSEKQMPFDFAQPPDQDRIACPEILKTPRAVMHWWHQNFLARQSLGMRPTLDASARLTKTFESLEQILLHTDVVAVFCAQRVNTSFKDTINNSRLLQQKLFFAPLPANGSYQETQLNPLLVNKNVLERLPLFYCGYGYNSMTHVERWPGKRLHPDMPKITHYVDDENAADRIDWELSVWNGPKVEEVMGAGSWRQMLLTQPACVGSIAIRSDRSMYEPDARSRATISTEHVMDKFIDALVDAELEGEI